jgi:hypothetical protein
MRNLSVLALRIGITFTLSSTLAGCGAVGGSPENPYKYGPGYQTKTANIAGGELKTWTPKADILFVVDDSLSMDAHQANVTKNIDGFIDAFKKNALLDYHIAVTQIFDSVKFGHTYNGRSYTDFSPLGVLCPLHLNKDDLPKVSHNPNEPSMSHNPCDMNFTKTQKIDSEFQAPVPAKDGTIVPCDPATHSQSFITRNTCNGLEAIRRTMKMGTRRGPEFEEVFSPAMAVAQNTSMNEGFLRPDATLIIVLVTDADDSTPGVTPDSLYNALIQAKGGDRSKVKLIGAISTIEDTKCEKDPSGPPYRITRLMHLANSEPISLCSPSFGAQMAKLGDEFSASIAQITFQLPYEPDQNTLKVRYGVNQEVPHSYNDGFSYDPDTKQLTISGHAKLVPEAGAQFQISFNAANALNGFVQVVGTPEAVTVTAVPPAGAATPVPDVKAGQPAKPTLAK